MATFRNTNTCIYTYAYTQIYEYTHIFPYSVSLEGLEKPSQEHQASLALRFCFLIPFFNRRSRFLRDMANSTTKTGNIQDESEAS